MIQELSSLQNPKGSFLGNSAITLHLSELGYSKESLESLLKCGQSTGFNVLRSCNCRNEIIPVKHHCNLRICPECSKIRKRRIVRKYGPLLRNLAQDRTYFIYFLTISPQNYTNLEEGLIHIKKSFSKFLRHNYIKERIKAGFYVIETKGGEGNWNIHIHALVYGRWLDNKIRGTCLECGQHSFKYDRFSHKFFCVNHKCNSTNVLIKEESKITSLFHQSSKRKANVHIQRQGSSMFSLNYMCKYIASNKDDFTTDLDSAKYICAIQTKRLINSFGLFYKLKINSSPPLCCNCGSIIHYSCDREVLAIFDKSNEPPPNSQPQKRLRDVPGFLVVAQQNI